MEPDANVTLQSVQTSELYQGPIPHPDILMKFGAVNPEYPERIMRMAEEAAQTANKSRNRDSINSVLGSIFSFLLGIAGFGASVAFALNGMEGGAIAVAIGGVAPIAVAALANLRK
jgi:uncharacterized membrane protein